VKAALVVTSINDCTELLNGYLANFAKYGRQAKIFLIPDKKTPKQELQHCAIVPTISGQQDFLSRVGFPYEDIPLNSDNRRNVGYLMALDSGAEVIVSIDDDNYCPKDEDFIAQHRLPMGSHYPSTDTPWVNNCDLLFRKCVAYPRGFPYFARNYKKVRYERVHDLFEIRINAGMWIGDPDFDAITWLSNPPTTATTSKEITLGKNAWCPINS
jgi:hypothetical protein